MPNPDTSYRFIGDNEAAELAILNYPETSPEEPEAWQAQLWLDGGIVDAEYFSTELEALQYGVRSLADTYRKDSTVTVTRTGENTITLAIHDLVLIEGQGPDEKPAGKDWQTCSLSQLTRSATHKQ